MITSSSEKNTWLPLNQKFDGYLPKELLTLIFCFLPFKELHNTVCINRTWYEASINARKVKLLKPINLASLAFPLIDRQIYPNEVQALAIIANHALSPEVERNQKKIKFHLNPVSLAKVEEKFYTLEEELIHILKNLSLADLTNLSKQIENRRFSYSYLCKIFNLAKIYQQRDNLSKISNLNERMLKIEKIAFNLFKYNRLDKLVEVCHMIPIGFRRDQCFIQYAQLLACCRCFNAALTLICFVSSELDKSTALKKIIKRMIQTANFDKALEIIPYLDDLKYKNKTYNGIAKKLAIRGLATRSIEVALLIYPFKEREKAIYELGIILIKNGTIPNLGFPRSYSLCKVKNYFNLPLTQTQELKKIIYHFF